MARNRIRIHKEGYRIIVLVFIILAGINVGIHYLWPESVILRWVMLGGSLLFFAFILLFFRTPARKIEPDPLRIYAPADGKVVVIEETFEKETFKDIRLQ